nr:serine acetyltransferase [uncultured Cellulosilyticum sp.]
MDKGVKKIYNLERKLYIKKVPVVPKIIKGFIRIVFSATIPYTSVIGEGTRFPHGGQGVVIHEEAVIGENCVIQANAIIGGRKGRSGAPNIGNDVLIGAGAVILGNINIGNHVAIGANAVVTKSIPNNAVVMGNPGVITRYLSEDENVK